MPHTRQYFSDTKRILKKANSNYKAGLAGLKKWWSRKYKLPPNHPLFINQSLADLTLEMYEDSLVRKDEIMEELKEAKGEASSALLKQLNAVSKLLGEDEYTSDPLIDKWERELEEGLTPDLNETL